MRDYQPGEPTATPHVHQSTNFGEANQYFDKTTCVPHLRLQRPRAQEALTAGFGQDAQQGIVRMSQEGSKITRRSGSSPSEILLMPSISCTASCITLRSTADIGSMARRSPEVNTASAT